MDASILSRLDRAQKELQNVLQFAKEQTSRSSAISALEDIKQVSGQLRLEHFVKNRIPELNPTSIRQLNPTNERPVTVYDVTAFLESCFQEKKLSCMVGPHIVNILEPCRDHLEKTLTSQLASHDNLAFKNIADKLFSQQQETGNPQVAVLSGISGSGKTRNALQIIRKMFEVTDDDLLTSRRNWGKFTTYCQCIL